MSANKSDIKNFSVLTLGCSKNVFDSERVIGDLQAANLEFTEDANNTDALIINTCGFIKPAKQESIDLIMQAAQARKANKLKKLIVTGCLTQRYNEELRSQIKDVDSFIGLNDSKKILKALNVNLMEELLGERYLLTPSHFSFFKISEGCSRKCSFCAIPLMRGKHVSRNLEELLNEAELLAQKGVKELVVIAQDSTFYGLDLYKKRILAKLLNQLSKIEGIEWIRIMYAFPNGFPYDVLDEIRDNQKICNYLDIPLQHVSSKLLKSMRRGVDGDKIRSLMEKFRSKVPGIRIRSTFIVGYPGETEKDFNQLYDFLEEYQLDRVGVFTYSHEENTHAFNLIDDVPEEIKQERRNALMELQHDISFEKNQKLIGQKMRVIIDEKRGIDYVARSEFDAPEVDNSVLIRQKSDYKIGDMAEVVIKSADPYDLHAEFI